MCIYKTTATSPYWKHKTNCTFLRIAVTSKANKAAKRTSARPREVQAKPENTRGLCCSLAQSLWPVPSNSNTIFTGLLGYVTERKSELVTVLFSTSISQTKHFSFLFHRSKLKPSAAFFTLTFLQINLVTPAVLLPQAGTYVCCPCFVHALCLCWVPLPVDDSWKVPNGEIPECWKMIVDPSSW